MGLNSSVTQSTSYISNLFRSYQIIKKDQSSKITIVKQKISDLFFIIKEITFSQKLSFEKHLCRFNHLHQSQQSENTLNIHKVWIEEHSNFCSNTFKIFPMYQYSNITLLDQIQARKHQLKYFEQQQLLGIIQCSINAFNFQSPILLSLNQFYIVSDGFLKVNNSDLFNTNILQSFEKGYFYSPQKMHNFNDVSFYENDHNFIKQTIFSLGMTILSAIYLQDLSCKVYDPLNLNKKMKINFGLLQNLISNINAINSHVLCETLLQLLRKMLSQNQNQRPSLVQIQQQIQFISKSKSHTQVSIALVQNQSEKVLKSINLNQLKNQQNGSLFFKGGNLSAIQNKFLQNFSTFRNKIKTDNSQQQILKQLTIREDILGKQNCIGAPVIVSQNAGQLGDVRQAQRKEQLQLPCPISEENPLFTSRQFLAVMNQQIKRFRYYKMSPFTSTQISRQNSNIFVLKQSQIQNQSAVNI